MDLPHARHVRQLRQQSVEFLRDHLSTQAYHALIHRHLDGARVADQVAHPRLHALAQLGVALGLAGRDAIEAAGRHDAPRAVRQVFARAFDEIGGFARRADDLVARQRPSPPPHAGIQVVHGESAGAKRRGKFQDGFHASSFSAWAVYPLLQILSACRHRSRKKSRPGQAAFLRGLALTLVLARAVLLDAAAARRCAGASSSFAALRREVLRAGSCSSSGAALAPAPLRRLRRSSSVRSRMSALGLTSSPSIGFMMCSPSPAFTFSSTNFSSFSRNSSWKASGFHLSASSPTSCSAIFSSRSLTLASFASGRGRPAVSRTSSCQRSNSSTSPSLAGNNAARCCRVEITTRAMPTLRLRRKVSSSSR